MLTKFHQVCTKFVINTVWSQYQVVSIYAFLFCQICIHKHLWLTKKWFFPALSHDAFYFLSPLKLYQMVKHIILSQNPYKHGLYPFSSTCYLGIVPDNSELKGDTNKVRFSVVLPYFGGDSWICNSSWLIGN